MTLRLYNTLSRREEQLVPRHPGRVSMYTCGPTVWNYAHIGNFRTFLFEDLLRRWLEASGYQVYHIMNLTDVDDRTIKAAADKGLSLKAHVEPYTQAFFEDRDYLRIRPAHDYPRATEFIPPMIHLVQGLLDKGVAYRGDDRSVYFSIDKFPAYGQLSQLDKRQLLSGASGRVSADEYAKEDARDFVLWKAASELDEQVGAAWDAPFGRGRPGWHLECSAMALDLLEKKGWGDVLDIHAGGVDLIFPHHEDEIAQSCAFTGQPTFATIWMHGEFLNVRGTKMSKRFGNITTARDLKNDGVDAGAIRLLMFQTHYRQRLDLTDEALEAAREGATRLGNFQNRLATAAIGDGAQAETDTLAADFRREFAAALDDDLNGPRAVAALFNFVTAANRLLDQRTPSVLPLKDSFAWATGVLDVLPAEKQVDQALQQWVELRLEARRDAKKRRDFVTADAIRAELGTRGVVIEDTPQGTKWRLG
jgi:cysteinyl-tRNA synthetase